jgi:hypothetical protein
MFGLSRIEMILIGALVLIAATGGIVAYIYNKGDSAGSAKVTSAVEHTTNVEVQGARKSKEATDEKVRTDPADAVIDRTR